MPLRQDAKNVSRMRKDNVAHHETSYCRTEELHAV